MSDTKGGLRYGRLTQARTCLSLSAISSKMPATVNVSSIPVLLLAGLLTRQCTNQAFDEYGLGDESRSVLRCCCECPCWARSAPLHSTARSTRIERRRTRQSDQRASMHTVAPCSANWGRLFVATRIHHVERIRRRQQQLNVRGDIRSWRKLRNLDE
jgi:hypothetical protein